jgi:hypothetical protein
MRHTLVIAAFASFDAVPGIHSSAVGPEGLLGADAPIRRGSQLLVPILFDNRIDKDVHAFVPQVAAMRRVEVARRDGWVIHGCSSQL